MVTHSSYTSHSGVHALCHNASVHMYTEDRLRLFSVVQLIDKGRTKAKHSVISFLTIFLISGLCSKLKLVLKLHE